MIRCRSSLTNCQPPTDNRLAGSRLAARSRGCSVRIALDVELGELVRLRLDLKRQAAHRDWGRRGGGATVDMHGPCCESARRSQHGTARVSSCGCPGVLGWTQQLASSAVRAADRSWLDHRSVMQGA